MIEAARHYWNAVVPLVGDPMERQLLREPLEVVLRCVAATAEKDIGKDDEVCYNNARQVLNNIKQRFIWHRLHRFIVSKKIVCAMVVSIEQDTILS